MENNASRAAIVITDAAGNPIPNVDRKQSAGGGLVDTHPGSDNGGSGGDFIDPASLARSTAGTTGGEQRRKRGRPKGSSNVGKKEKGPSNLRNIIARAIFTAHSFMLMSTKAPEWQISRDEAQSIGDAFDKLAAQYDVALSDKQEAWLDFGSAVAGVYGPRIGHYAMRAL